jgi:hypothetical protein
MIPSYRLLIEDMPAPQGQGTATFHADARKTKQWVAALPRANALATQQSLRQALDSLSSQKLDGSLRLTVLEELRSAVGESIGLLKGEYAGSALPLDAAKSSAAQQVEDFHLALAHGYRKAAIEICAPEGNIPMLRGGTVALALARATWHYSQALAVAWRVYRAPEHGVWQGLHRVLGFAVNHRLDARQIPDPLAGSSIEVRASYLQAMLMAVTHPLAFSQHEQDALWQITGDLASRCALLRSPPQTNSPVVPEDSDRGPGPGVLGETPTRWLDMTPFCSAVDAALARQQEGFSNLVPARGLGIRVSVEMLERLKRSFGLAAARSHKRLEATHGMITIFGLSALHFYLAGQRDFEAFMRHASLRLVHVADRALWTHSSTDPSRMPMHEARVLDQSLGGYRMAWDHASQIRARVGELVGLSLADPGEEPEWMIGVVRWLRYEDDGGLSAGVELISRRTSAVGLRVHGKDGFIQDPIRAVEMEALDDSTEINFLVPNNLSSGATRIEVVRDEGKGVVPGAPGVEEILAGIDAMVNAGDYALLRPLRADLVADENSGVTG